MKSDFLDYSAGDVTCQAFVAYDDKSTDKRPCVLICHAWGGQSEFEQEKAEKLAELGYVGFAVDVYGKGKRGTNMDENAKLMQPFIDDRKLLLSRLRGALAAAKNHPLVDANRIAVMGYCFGGLCALDLARCCDPDVKGAVSFHGLFTPPNIGAQGKISASILILHGYDDPMAKPDSVLEVADELNKAGADWQLHAYSHTVHAFTSPTADMPEHGILYNASADRRSWIAMKNFFQELFA
jgi:dienelactone hydrolase